MLANWTITPLPLDDLAALRPLWKPVGHSTAAPTVSTPRFFRGTFSIPAGDVADTFLTLFGWVKGQVWVNNNNLARYWSVGPQFSFYCPAGFLTEGQNEVILLETGGAPANLTVEFKAAHTTIGPQPPPPLRCPPGFTSHAPGFWANPWPCGLSGQPHCTQDNSNVTAAACGRKCELTPGCLAFEVYQAQPAKACYIFIDVLKPPFAADPDCFTCVRNKSSETYYA